MELLKLLSANEIVAQILSFLILLAFLRIFLWKPFLRLLDNRRQAIASDYKKAEDVKAEMERLKAFYVEQLEKIDEVGRRRIQETVVEGYKEANKIREEARIEAQKIIDAGKAYMQAEFTKVESRVKDRIVDLTLEAAGMVLEQKFSEQDDRKMVSEFIEKLEQGKTGLVG